ncbi:MAG: HpcH/HpaI aldolase/citrate lyase family protein [Candidatus Heimdallarchaeota archaeon]
MMVNEIREFKEKLKTRSAYGLFSKTNDPGMVETAGYAGFDFIILDLEHGPNSVENVQNLLRAAQISHILPIVRLKVENPSVIGEVLDIGVAGIQVPQVTNAQTAKNTVKLAKFAPEGERGVCRYVRAAKYSSMDRFEYFKTANEALVILQLEGQEALDNLDEILDVPGIDIIFIGPYDLSQSLGVLGKIDDPIVEAKMREIIEKSRVKGVFVGTFVETIADAKKWKAAGVKYIAYSVDMGLFYDQCKFIVESLK